MRTIYEDLKQVLAREALAGFRFKVSITGAKVFTNMGFNKVSGLESEVNFTEYREGTDGLKPRKVAGMIADSDITLERGLSTDQEAVEALELLQTKPQSESVLTVTITLLDREGTPRREYFIPRAWIKKLSHGDFDAKSEDAVMETIILAHEGFTTKAL